MMKLKRMVKASLRRIPGLRRMADKFDETNHQIRAQNEAMHNMEGRLRALEEQLQFQTNRVNTLENYAELLFKQVVNENDAVATAKSYVAAIKEQEDDGKKPRMAVYTVLMGPYDVLHAPAFVDSYCDYFCITNNKELKSSFWKIIYMENEEGLDNIRFQRKLKLSPHLIFPEYEHSLYVDAAVLIHKSVWDWIERFSTGKSLLVYRHPERDCIYDEGEICIRLGKDRSDIINAQMERYRQIGYPSNNALVWSAILYRKHNDPELIRVHQNWLEEINRGSRRDQLSFNYACWKNGFAYDEAIGDYRDYFLWSYLHDGKFR